MALCYAAVGYRAEDLVHESHKVNYDYESFGCLSMNFIIIVRKNMVFVTCFALCDCVFCGCCAQVYIFNDICRPCVFSMLTAAFSVNGNVNIMPS